MMQFRQIEAFRCLMMAGTSVGAARKMNVTQPAISRLIADLENECNVCNACRSSACSKRRGHAK